MGRVAALLLALAAAPAGADDIRPGLWKITLETRAATTPEYRPAPAELTECFEEGDREHPERLLTGYGMMGAYQCELQNREQSAGHLRFDVSCAGSLGIQGHGEMSYTDKTVEGTLDVNFGSAPRSGLQNRLLAVYQGECQEPERPPPLPLN